MYRRDLQETMHQWAQGLTGATVFTRHAQRTCVDLWNLDRNPEARLNADPFKHAEKVICYGCSKLLKRSHPVYLFSCAKCGDKFQRYRNLARDLTGLVCLVTGARTKLGHQICVKLLEAGANVVGTTRFPAEAKRLYEQYPHWDAWKERLFVYGSPLDLNVSDISGALTGLVAFVESTFGRLDVLVNCAAQTIRQMRSAATQIHDKNRYNDPAFVARDPTQVNSWKQGLDDLQQLEMEEVYRVNAVAPCLIVQAFVPLLRRSTTSPYVINVHAREGLINVDKTDRHVHTNMAKVALAMLTKCSKEAKYKTLDGRDFYFHGIDPGWFSVDEYHEDESPFRVAPLDEVDAAARVLFVVMSKVKGSFAKTRRHFFEFLY